jgi:hypothetical protein
MQGESYTPPEPLASFPTITSGITGKWDRNGIMCSRCHASTFPAITSSTITNQADCVANGGSWSSTASSCSLTSTHNVTPSLTGDGVTSLGPPQIVRICFGCHQSLAKGENSVTTGLPMTDLNLDNIPVWTTYRKDFAGSIIGNNFLNSPHARMTGGTVYPNVLGNYDLTGGTYNSAFKGYVCRSSRTRNSGAQLSTILKKNKVSKQYEIHRIETLEDCNIANGFAAGNKTDYGYWQAETQGSCSTCHNVHQSLVDDVKAEEPFYRECTDCHSKKRVSINHPSGRGTPLANAATDPDGACEICHMPRAGELTGNENYPSHLFRINTDPTYSTFPIVADFEKAGVCADSDNIPLSKIESRTDCTPGMCSIAGKSTRSDCDAVTGAWSTSSTNRWTSTAIANSAKETFSNGTQTIDYTNAVWNDLDMSCGQCHGGSGGRTKTKNRAPYIDKNTLSLYAKSMHYFIAPPKVGYTSPSGHYVTGGYEVTLTDTSTDELPFFPNAILINWGDKSTSTGNAGGTFKHTYAVAAKARNVVVTYSVINKKGKKSRKVFSPDVS